MVKNYSNVKFSFLILLWAMLWSSYEAGLPRNPGKLLRLRAEVSRKLMTGNTRIFVNVCWRSWYWNVSQNRITYALWVAKSSVGRMYHAWGRILFLLTGGCVPTSQDPVLLTNFFLFFLCLFCFCSFRGDLSREFLKGVTKAEAMALIVTNRC